MAHKIQVGWLKWRKTSDIICAHKVVTKMMVLRWMCGHTRIKSYSCSSHCRKNYRKLVKVI
uniref:Uncharacterized protein n=1 Tax=Cajanus cajan TaxID=3821 RepID=A0A151SXZ2_CAJCA|nr:hypothetical protein KK1_015110 [Cajanus cajan]